MPRSLDSQSILDHLIKKNMEVITKTPGFQHLSEDILKLLDKKSLMDCRFLPGRPLWINQHFGLGR